MGSPPMRQYGELAAGRRHHLVTTVIPVYNRAEAVREAIASVVAQEVPPGWTHEVIVVDDGSTDGSAEAAGDALASASRAVTTAVVQTPHTGRPGAARNAGIRRARGELIAFLDSDDIWLAGKLSRQIPLHHESGVALSHTRERWVRDGRVVSQRRQRHRHEGAILDDALHKCIIGPSTALVDAALLAKTGPFREDLEVGEDYELWLRCLCHTDVAWLAEPLTEKRAGSWDQLSTRYEWIEPFRIEGLRPLVDEALFARTRGRESHDRARSILAAKCRIVADGAGKRGRTDLANHYDFLARRYGLPARDAPGA